jgi:hypothetical protein
MPCLKTSEPPSQLDVVYWNKFLDRIAGRRAAPPAVSKKRADTLLEIASLFPYSVESPGS